ncbi:uncharacterized protein SOCE836_089010 [Sorangium cellulosum]|uniref:Uncharacterized protein n=1 Tax=Sorangium cellulosum TaxID=56 RepID=A0A4V0NHH5_SORCE|nr:uncharacterized protein SOCE836_089010 [Sorangium cellulosum]WCQ95990.1 hypothetical protein NQZ70_08767 [Sorangium sp. Soce836]
MGVRVEQPRSDELSTSVHHRRPAQGLDVALGGGGALCARELGRAADERHPRAQRECHRLSQDERLSRSGGLETSRGQTSGLPGRRPGRGRGERFGGHGRRLGSSSTAAKRRSHARGEVASALQHGWAQPPRAFAPLRRGDAPAGGWGSPHDVDSAGGRIGGGHVAVDPGERLGPETKARAYRHAAGAERNAEMKDLRSSAPGWAGTAASSMTAFLDEGGSPGGVGLLRAPSVRRPLRLLRGGSRVSGAQESQPSWECRWLPAVTGLPAARAARQQERPQRGGERTAALSIAPLLGLGRAWLRGSATGLRPSERSQLAWLRGATPLGRRAGWSPARPVAPARHEGTAGRELASAGSRRELRG